MEFQNRASITIGPKRKKICYYSDDLNELKALVTRIRVASNPELKKGLPNLMSKASTVYNVNKFVSAWELM